MEKLFLISIGGKVANGNIEVHDLQFVIAKSIEETHQQLKDNWFGLKDSLHMDSYAVIEGVDGYEINIKDTPQESNESLYLVFVGGYQKGQLLEKHNFGLFVSETSKQAKSKAMTEFLGEWSLEHVDGVVSVQDCISNNRFTHLVKSDHQYLIEPVWQGYKKL